MLLGSSGTTDAPGRAQSSARGALNNIAAIQNYLVEWSINSRPPRLQVCGDAECPPVEMESEIFDHQGGTSSGDGDSESKACVGEEAAATEEAGALANESGASLSARLRRCALRASNRLCSCVALTGPCALPWLNATYVYCILTSCCSYRYVFEPWQGKLRAKTSYRYSLPRLSMAAIAQRYQKQFTEFAC